MSTCREAQAQYQALEHKYSKAGGSSSRTTSVGDQFPEKEDSIALGSGGVRAAKEGRRWTSSLDEVGPECPRGRRHLQVSPSLAPILWILEGEREVILLTGSQGHVPSRRVEGRAHVHT